MLFSSGLTPGPFAVVLRISLVVSASQLRLAIELVHPSAVLKSSVFRKCMHCEVVMTYLYLLACLVPSCPPTHTGLAL